MPASIRHARALIVAVLLMASAFVVVASGAPDAGAVSPGLNGVIAFTRYFESANTYRIYTVAPDGTDLTQLTSSWAAMPSFRGDGSQLAYFGPGGVSTMNSDGTNQQTMAPPHFGGYTLAWSPDGTTFATNEGQSGDSVGIALATIGEPEVQHILDNDGTSEWGPSWSPDGTQLVYSRDEGNIWLVNADGSNNHLAVEVPEPGQTTLPKLSADGSRIVFSFRAYDREKPNDAIYVANTDGSDLYRVGPTEGSNTEPTFSPDGNWIAFTHRTTADEGGLHTMRLDGSELVQLTHDVRDSNANWQPLSSPPLPTTTTTVPATTTTTTNKPPIPWGTLAKPTPRRLTANGSKAYDPDGSIVKYAWYWGDGTTPGWTMNASHTYTKPGNYMVSLSVTDNKGARTTGGVWIRIT